MNIFSRIIGWFKGIFKSEKTAGKEPDGAKSAEQNPSQKSPLDLNKSQKITSKIREEVNKDKFLDELKAAEPFEKQFEPLKKEFIQEIKQANPRKNKEI